MPYGVGRSMPFTGAVASGSRIACREIVCCPESFASSRYSTDRGRAAVGERRAQLRRRASVIERSATGGGPRDARPEVTGSCRPEGDGVARRGCLRGERASASEMRDYGEHARRFSAATSGVGGGADGAEIVPHRDRRQSEDAYVMLVEVVLGRVACAAGDFVRPRRGRVLIDIGIMRRLREVAMRAASVPVASSILNRYDFMPVVLSPFSAASAESRKFAVSGLCPRAPTRFAQAPRFSPDAANAKRAGADGVAARSSPTAATSPRIRTTRDRALSDTAERRACGASG